MKPSTAFSIVKPAIGKKELIPLLTHVHFNDRRLQATNLVVTIDTECDFKHNITVPADMLGTALSVLDPDHKIELKDKTLFMSYEKTVIKIPISVHEEYPRQKIPEGTPKSCKGIKKAFKKLWEFIGTDASRPWSCGILLGKDYAYATNNICIVRTPFKNEKLTVVPEEVVEIVLSIEQEPEKILITNDVVVFFYKKFWVRSVLIAERWPDVSRFFVKEAETPLPEGVFEATARVAKFVPDVSSPVIIFDEEGIRTLEADRGAKDSSYSFKSRSAFTSSYLLSVLKIATAFDYTEHPKPCPFKGTDIEGLVMGVRI